MKVGDYVRYKKLIYHNQGVDDIRISKIKDIEDTKETGYNQKFIFFENGNGEYEDRIIKSSPNIIDLIQVGDYVNGYKVISIGIDDNHKNVELYVANQGYDELVLAQEIKSIVTEEMFSQMEYKVGE